MGKIITNAKDLFEKKLNSIIATENIVLEASVNLIEFETEIFKLCEEIIEMGFEAYKRLEGNAIIVQYQNRDIELFSHKIRELAKKYEIRDISGLIGIIRQVQPYAKSWNDKRKYIVHTEKQKDIYINLDAQTDMFWDEIQRFLEEN